MICDKYKELSIHERNVFICEIQHCIQSDDNAFEFADEMVKWCKKIGIFKGVKINPLSTIETIPEIKELNPAHSGVLFTTIEKL